MAPSDGEWTQYRANLRTWQSLSWPLDSYRSTSGTRAVACQTEIADRPRQHGFGGRDGNSFLRVGTHRL